MKRAKTTFYFKDGTTLVITGDYGTYNNKTFDMAFKDNIVAEFQNNVLYADNLNYRNMKSLLTIYGNVSLIQKNNKMFGERLVLNLKDGVAKISGSVRTIITPTGKN